MKTTIYDVLFLDIETITGERYLMPDTERTRLFQKRYKHLYNATPNIQWEDIHNDQGALSAEFGKILNISIAQLKPTTEGKDCLFVKSICSKDEKWVLNEFFKSYQKSKAGVLCAHNGLEFDFPFLLRRALINQTPFPHLLQPFGKKVYEMWDLLHDTMKIWGSTQYKGKISLELMAFAFGIESPKGDLDGSKINELWHSRFDYLRKEELPFDREEKIVARIEAYGAGDVITLAKLYALITGSNPITDDQVKIMKNEKV